MLHSLLLLLCRKQLENIVQTDWKSLQMMREFLRVRDTNSLPIPPTTVQMFFFPHSSHSEVPTTHNLSFGCKKKKEKERENQLEHKAPWLCRVFLGVGSRSRSLPSSVWWKTGLVCATVSHTAHSLCCFNEEEQGRDPVWLVLMDCLSFVSGQFIWELQLPLTQHNTTLQCGVGRMTNGSDRNEL